MFCAPSRTTSERGKPRLAQRLTSFSRHSSSVTSRLNLVSNQATSRRVSLRWALSRPSRPDLGVRLLQVVGDRLAVADDEGAVDQHRRLRGRVEPQQLVGLRPRAGPRPARR